MSSSRKVMLNWSSIAHHGENQSSLVFFFKTDINNRFKYLFMTLKLCTMAEPISSKQQWPRVLAPSVDFFVVFFSFFFFSFEKQTKAPACLSWIFSYQMYLNKWNWNQSWRFLPSSINLARHLFLLHSMFSHFSLVFLFFFFSFSLSLSLALALWIVLKWSGNVLT